MKGGRGADAHHAKCEEEACIPPVDELVLPKLQVRAGGSFQTVGVGRGM